MKPSPLDVAARKLCEALAKFSAAADLSAGTGLCSSFWFEVSAAYAEVRQLALPFTGNMPSASEAMQTSADEADTE